MSDETTTEQLAEIEGQTESTPVTEYTPPEGWRVLAVGEALREGDVTVRKDGYCYPTERVGGWVGANQRYIRPIEPQPEAQSVQVREGRWRTRSGEEKNIRPCEPLQGAHFVWPWTDGIMTFQDNGRHQGSKESPNDLVHYLGPIEPDKTQELPDKTQELQAEYTPPDGWRVLQYGELLQPGDHWVNWEGTVSRPDIQHGDGATVSGGRYIRNIDIELQTVRNQLGESRQRVTQLEDLVGSLRTINRGCENAVRDAGKENTALKNQLAAVKAELVTQAETSRRLQIELDAAQQVPADLPELRQLRADLAEVTQDRDTYRDGYERVLSDLRTIRETTKAETVEAILEWLEPVRVTIEAADNVQQTMRADNLACDIIRNLPGILRYVVGLNHPEEIE